MDTVYKRDPIPEDVACWWCGSPMSATNITYIDIQDAVFCSPTCNQKWHESLRAMEDRFQEWDD